MSQNQVHMKVSIEVSSVPSKYGFLHTYKVDIESLEGSTSSTHEIHSNYTYLEEEPEQLLRDVQEILEDSHS